MKGKFTVPEQELEFDMENVSIQQYIQVGTRPMQDMNIIEEKFPIGEPITVITSNMPPALKEMVDDIIKQYCGH